MKHSHLSVSVITVAMLSASPAFAVSYEELIFCSRWYAGVNAALRASGLGEDESAKTAQIEGRMFGYRALAATPKSELQNATRVVTASNDAVNRILAYGTPEDWDRVHQTCGALR